jgi:RNA ligase (TIGR02306 family)
MSIITITVERIEAVEAHPQADRLEIVKVAGTQSIVPKGQYKTGDLCVYFPPDIMLPADVSARLGVAKYLKTAFYNGDRLPCRVAATRLRGTPSYGFVQPLSALNKSAAVGTDVTAAFQGLKYEAPVRTYRGFGGGTGEVWGSLARPPLTFHEYTDIQHYRKYRHLLVPETPVRVTEKVHGTNSRVGVLRVNDEWQFIAGSHKTARKMFDNEGRESIYWKPLGLESVLLLLNELCDEQNDVIFFGELYGPGIQDMGYGVASGDAGYRLFDISVNGRYLNWDVVKTCCSAWDVPTVPLLYEGPFEPDFVESWTNGPTTVVTPDQIKGFKGREGCVITPQIEQTCHIGRLILKSVSVDYLDRSDAKDEGDL